MVIIKKTQKFNEVIFMQVPQGSVSDAVLATDHVMAKLMTNPEAFSKVVGPLVTSLSTSISDSTTLEAVVEHIFQQVIS